MALTAALFYRNQSRDGTLSAFHRRSARILMRENALHWRRGGGLLCPDHL